MESIISVPQFKKDLVKVMRNYVPSCTVEFGSDQGRHLKFRLIDESGRYRSNLITLLRVQRNLQKANLVSAIRGAGVPDGGLPLGF